MKILAIRFARLGDVVLLVQALSALKARYPDAELTLLTGCPCAPIGELCPAVDEVLPIDRIAMRDSSALAALVEMVRLVRTLRKRKFDLVIDFHSFRETNLLTWLSGAPARVGIKRHKAPYLGFCFNRPPVLEDKSLHVAEMFDMVARTAAFGSDGSGVDRHGLLTHHPNALVIPDNLKDWANEFLQPGPRLALYVDAPVAERIWPLERFAEIADFAVEQLGAAVLVMAGPSGLGLTARLQKILRNPDKVSIFASITVPQLAALIASSRLFVSNDTGPMHLGPAVGVPTLGLFSVGFPEHFRPIGPADQYLRGNPIENIQVKDVVEAIGRMWATAGLDFRR